MFKELLDVLECVQDERSAHDQYKEAIVAENCTRKPTEATRRYTASYLTDLYGLDPDLVLFRALRYFWSRDEQARSILCFLCAYARDSILCDCTPFVLGIAEGVTSDKDKLEEFIERMYPDRFSDVMRASLGRNLRSSWTQSGHLTGHRNKVRTRVTPSAGSVSYALLLGYLSGIRGESLFQSDYTKLLDCSFEKMIELTEEAARKGWIVFKRVGDVIEVLFPNIINAEELEWIRE
ncbi:hypothetical protein P4C99_11080 [Pontiellaceae bacterium B1224]|nr:hypothetical protein [Pontiellaceae bacterium B1224]